ncbi:MAG TPA: hypothetical protein VKM94_23510 [Blastocatellia bacterium]|nr:hypothetical protein [Blastocatellia bacterium]
MSTSTKRITSAFMIALIMFVGAGLVRGQQHRQQPRTAAQSSASGPVVGGGTPGQLTKWTGAPSSGTFTVGDSIITEDKLGSIGIGTTAPTSRLTVAGMIETTLGGYKFPDGTVQTTAGITSVFHDSSLAGNGTATSPLGIAIGGVTANRIANGTVVRSLNGLFDNVTLTAGNNITITPSGGGLTIAAPNSLSAINHDLTLSGDGTVASPLGIKIPLFLDGSVHGSPVLTVRNANGGSTGLFASGGDGSLAEAAGGGLGAEIRGGGGFGFSIGGGLGLLVHGGNAREGTPGDGIQARGGDSGLGFGGIGVHAIGGDTNEQVGGVALRAEGGASGSKFGGIGVISFGGLGSGNGNRGGMALFAQGGQGQAGATQGTAAQFNGDVEINGNLSKSGGSFKIDHPLDPANKYLYHSFVESPDMKNIYDGTVTTDNSGVAVVTLPDWFGALNKDFRYQLTVIGTFAQAIVAEEIKDNRFTIMTNAPNIKVSWQVTGIRQDAYANKNRIPVEVDKPELERGSFLHPEAFNEPEEKGVDWVRHPELMKQMKEARQQQLEKLRVNGKSN